MDSLVTGFSTKKHTAAMIPVFAFGPGAENFSGIYENTAIYYKIKNLLF
jgi:alkaline phosphatase